MLLVVFVFVMRPEECWHKSELVVLFCVFSLTRFSGSFMRRIRRHTRPFFVLFSGNDSDRVCLVGLTMEENTLYYTLAVILS